MGRLEESRASLGFGLVDVATAAGWSVDRQREIERTDDLTTEESDLLTRLLGLDIEGVLCGDEVPQPLATLLRGAVGELSAEDRFEVAEVATVAREYRRLLARLGRRDPWPLVARFEEDPDYGHPSAGGPERLASRVRDQLGLGRGPIPSVTQVVQRDLGVLIVWVDLPPSVDAFALASPDTGAVIALNRQGKHTKNAFHRRVTLAHEVCHLLFDRPHLRSMARFCRMADRRPRAVAPREPSLEDRIERRARAFAAWWLLPRAEGRRTWHALRVATLPERVRGWMEMWGIGYEAARGHLATLEQVAFDVRLPAVRTEPPPVWSFAEPGPPSDDAAARVGVPWSRRGTFFETVMDAVREQAIAPSRAQELLRLDRAAWSALVAEIPNPPAPRPSPEVSSSVLADWL